MEAPGRFASWSWEVAARIAHQLPAVGQQDARQVRGQRATLLFFLLLLFRLSFGMVVKAEGALIRLMVDNIDERGVLLDPCFPSEK